MRITICFCVLGLCTGALGYSYEYKEFELCYGDIGCFSNAKPFDNANGLIPESPENIQIKFLLYTRANTQSPQIVSTTPLSIQMSHFSSAKKTKFIIHGMSGKGEDPWVTKMTQAILKREDANVFVVDLSKGAEVVFLNLVRPVANTRVVGALIAQFIK